MRKLALTVALVTTALATPALARDKSWYVGIEGGGMIVEDIDYDVAGTPNAWTADNHTGFDVGGKLGYDFGPFRAEGEVAYKRAEVSDLTANALAAGVPLGTYDGRGHHSALSFMLNGMFDFGADDGWQASIGGGAGIARVSSAHLREDLASVDLVDDNASKFAWQILGEIRRAISSHVDAGLKYRFFNVNNAKLDLVSGNGTTNSDFRSHSLLATLTYNFGEPAAPPPPPPPPPVEAAPPPPPPPPPMVECQAGPYIVFFDFDKSDVTPEASSILESAVANYANCGNAAIQVAGHADKSGSDKYNQALSERRAGEVRGYLVSHGVADGVVATQGFGETMPLVDTADGVKEPQNRRVEIKYAK